MTPEATPPWTAGGVSVRFVYKTCDHIIPVDFKQNLNVFVVLKVVPSSVLKRLTRV